MFKRFIVSGANLRGGLDGWLLLACAAWLAVILGCDHTEPVADQRTELIGRAKTTDLSASRLLEQTAAAYARLERYSDEARVVLSYSLAGKLIQDEAPLALALERPNRLGLRAYQVRAGCEAERFRMRLSHDPQSPMANQVISRALPERLDVSWLMHDPIAAQYLSAGLGGSPPQLELLCGEQPFRGLLSEQASIAMDGEGIERGKLFPIVKVAHSAAIYRLWIDPQTSLLRRIELPTSNLPAAMREDQRVTDIHLSIEFDGVQTQREIDWAAWRVPVTSNDQLVRYFTRPPASTVDSRLGKTVPAFQLQLMGDDDDWVSSHKPTSEGKLQVLVWLADHTASRATLEQLERALHELPDAVRKRVVPLAVWAEPKPPAGSSFESLAADWQITMPIAWDRQAVGRDVLAIGEAPTVIILDDQHRLQFFHAGGHPFLSQILPELVTALAHGEDIAARNHLESQVAEHRFRGQLWLARASDCQLAAFTHARPYPPATIELAEPERLACDVPIAALVADAAHDLWVLRHDGRLEQRDRQGQLQASFETQLKPRGAAIPRLAIDRQSRYVALPGPQPATIQIVQLESKRISTVALSKEQPITEYRWLATATGPRLGVITSGSRMVLIDPANAQQHSGQAPALPVALLERTSSEPGVSGYAILADGRIEPILVQDQVGTGQVGMSQVERDKTVTAEPISTPALATSMVRSQGKSPRLSFIPSSGPWSHWSGAHTSATLARGRLAIDEPTLFMLDEHLNPQWHVPLPLAIDGEETLVAASPETSGQPLVWAVVQPQSTVHLMTSDGRIIDHCQFAEPIRGLALTTVGDQLCLWLAHPTALVRYPLRLPQANKSTAGTLTP